MTKRNVQVRLTLHDEADEHYDINWARLNNDVSACLKLMMQVLHVGARRLLPQLQSMPRDIDRAAILLNFEFMESNEETAPEIPAADSYQISVQVKRRRNLSKERMSMGLPELTFTLKKAAETVSTRISRGAVALILRDSKANGVHVVCQESDIPTSARRGQYRIHQACADGLHQPPDRCVRLRCAGSRERSRRASGALAAYT